MGAHLYLSVLPLEGGYLMSMNTLAIVDSALGLDNVNSSMTTLEAWLIGQDTTTYKSYYNGKMSYKLHGRAWEEYVAEAFPDLAAQHTSENIFKTVVDLYAENLVPKPKEMKGFSNCLVPLLSRGEAVVVVDQANQPHYPEHFEVISDGSFTVAAIFTRKLEEMKDYITFAYSDGKTRIFWKDVPKDLAAADRTQGFTFKAEETGSTLYRFALDDKGFGASLAALQDRLNHSIIDQTVVEEMYARPFWYLLNAEIPPKNPYLPAGTEVPSDVMREQKTKEGATGRIFTSSSDGPFGQLDPPTITDMISYHDSILDKGPQSFGIPAFYFKPGSGTPPTGVALMVLSKRFNNKISRMREDLQDTLEALAAQLGVKKKEAPEGEELDPDEEQYDLWPTNDDLMQEAIDAHGLSLVQMGYPLEYVATVVTPGVDLDDYADDSLGAPVPNPSGPRDMTALGQQGLPATPGQVAAYEQNPGQRARA